MCHFLPFSCMVHMASLSLWPEISIRPYHAVGRYEDTKEGLWHIQPVICQHCLQITAIWTFLHLPRARFLSELQTLQLNLWTNWHMYAAFRSFGLSPEISLILTFSHFNTRVGGCAWQPKLAIFRRVPGPAVTMAAFNSTCTIGHWYHYCSSTDTSGTTTAVAHGVAVLQW